MFRNNTARARPATSLAISASVQGRIHVSERVMRDGNHQDLLRPVPLESVAVSWVQFNAG